METVRCMLIDAKLEKKYWGEAVSTANYIQNRTPSRSIDGTPFQRWEGIKPDVSNFKIFGCIAYAHVPKEKRKKLDDKAVQLRFVGYDDNTKGYRLLNCCNNKITISRDVKFIPNNVIQEEQISKESIGSNSSENIHVIENLSSELTSNSDNGSVSDDYESLSDSDEEDFLGFRRRPTRINKGIPPKRYIYSCKDTSTQKEPGSYTEAITCVKKEFWINAMML